MQELFDLMQNEHSLILTETEMHEILTISKNIIDAQKTPVAKLQCSDGLNVAPSKLWTNNKFEGHYPVGTAAVVVAITAEEAADYLSLFLQENGLDSAKAEDMEEMPFVEGQVKILCDGNY